MKKTAILPGGFKPPHKGHYELALDLAEQSGAEVTIRVGPAERDGITQAMSIKIWELYGFKAIPAASGNPVVDVFEYVEKEAIEGETVYIGTGWKDYPRFKVLEDPTLKPDKYKQYNPKGITVDEKEITSKGGGINGKKMREFIMNDQKDLFQNNLPDHVDKDKIWNIVLDNIQEDLYDPNDHVLDYMKSSEWKAGMPDGHKDDDIEPGYKYRRGGMYTGGGMGAGGMYEAEETGKILHAYDFDDTIAQVQANIKVFITSPSGDYNKEILIPAANFPEESKELEARLGSLEIKYDFSEFEKQINDAIVNSKVINKLKTSLSNPQIKTTILTARSIGHPVTRYLKSIGLDAYVVPLGLQVGGKVTGQDKADWIENHINKGYKTVYFIDDSEENRTAVSALKDKHPDVNLTVEDPAAVRETTYAGDGIDPSHTSGYGGHDLISQYKNQIKNPQEYRDLQLMVAQNKDEDAKKWLKVNGYINEEEKAKLTDKKIVTINYKSTLEGETKGKTYSFTLSDFQHLRPFNPAVFDQEVNYDTSEFDASNKDKPTPPKPQPAGTSDKAPVSALTKEEEETKTSDGSEAAKKDNERKKELVKDISGEIFKGKLEETDIPNMKIHLNSIAYAVGLVDEIEKNKDRKFYFSIDSAFQKSIDGLGIYMPSAGGEEDDSFSLPKNADEVPDKVANAIGKAVTQKENFPPYVANQVQQTRYKASDVFTRDVKKSKKMGYKENVFSKNWWKQQLTEVMTETKANTHLTHLEELVLTQGQDGFNQAKSFLYELIKNLKGEDNSIKNVSVKWDGAPAIFTGINPENGQFFVGTKSVFNKDPKINYTSQDIDTNHGHAGGLAKKLKLALEYLPAVGINGILQGDFMFDSDDVDTQNIEEKPHYTFRPNTIRYAVEANSDLGRKINSAKIGIIFHTTYKDLSGGGASFGADINGLNPSSNVWFDDAYFKDDTGILLNSEEESFVLEKIKEADSINVDYTNLPLKALNTYLNQEIRQGEFLLDPIKSFEKFKNWYQLAVNKSIELVKRPETKEKKRSAGEEKLKEFESQKQDILNVFRLSKLLSEAKSIFITKYDKAVSTKHFIDNGDGTLSVTKAEGFVAVDHTENGIKLVDRLEFSKNNFNAGKPGS